MTVKTEHDFFLRKPSMQWLNFHGQTIMLRKESIFCPDQCLAMSNVF